RDRSAVTTDVILSEVTAQTLKNTLVPVLDKEAVLCHDGLPQYFTMARETGIAHRTVYAAHGKRVVKGIFHIQNVNAYHSRPKGWMERFHGVATRYLPNYCSVSRKWTGNLGMMDRVSPSWWTLILAMMDTPSVPRKSFPCF
ncbi:MAG: IS1595 family transposase, partial [Leptospirales bacterium]